MRTTKILLMLILLSFISCKGDGDSYVYPPIIFEFTTAQTNASGDVISIKTDKGITYQIDKLFTNSKLSANTQERIICYYTLIKEGGTDTKADLYAIAKPFTTIPKHFNEKDRKTDPVGVQSAWLAGEFINITALIKAQNKGHEFHFMEDAITTENGIPTITITLYHDKNGDMEAYTKMGYLSIPLMGYISQYPHGFNILLNINTYDGIKKFPFSYQSAVK